MNTPYVKQYNEVGEVINPITKKTPYLNVFKNRRQRREKEPRFRGESKNWALTVLGRAKYYRVIQVINLKNGKTKRIKHYIEAKPTWGLKPKAA